MNKLTEFQAQEYETLKEFENYINKKYGCKQNTFFVNDVMEFFKKFDISLHDGMYIKDKLVKLRLNRDILKNNNIFGGGKVVLNG